MRIWSIHPKYLDTVGLTACWREALLAKKVLEGKTKGYTQHPQLSRFREKMNPLLLINTYLKEICDEAERRGYNYDRTKFDFSLEPVKLTVTRGQLNYEFQHLLQKLKTRKPELYKKLNGLKSIEPHPLFEIIDGEIEKWEIIKK